MNKEILNAKKITEGEIRFARKTENKEMLREMDMQFQILGKEYRGYTELALKIFALFSEGQFHDVEELAEKVKKIEEELERHIERLVGQIEGFTEKTGLNAKKIGEAGVRTMLIATITSLVIGIVFAWTIVRQIRHRMGAVNEIVPKAAHGYLAQGMEIASKNELGVIGKGFNEMMDKFARVITQVREASNFISSTSTQISTGNQNLSIRASKEAIALEETTSSMEEMTSTVKQNADNAKEAKQLWISSREKPEKGRRVVGHAVTAMTEMKENSKEVVDIITIINEIAFQTNLLALNAAVEAARARPGEHGRGFAVVAAKVQNLVQRSAKAAKEIKLLINESVQEISKSTELVNRSGEALGKIVSSLNRVTDILSEISVASREQSLGIDQVNKATLSMSNGTQQNFKLVEEPDPASVSLKEMAENLIRRWDISS